MSKKKARRYAAASAAEFAQSARESAEDAFDAAREAAEDGLDQAHDYLKRQWEDRPIAVAGAALGIGLVLGLLLGSRR
jgi:ElaB/YqjD/DUF883 family membrane-anchored ribosome-binding protein